MNSDSKMTSTEVKLKNILIVDDDDVDIKIYKRAFSLNQIHNPLYFAHNGREALELLNGGQYQHVINPLPEVIILNIQMPQMSGLELLKLMRSDPNMKHISVFMFTSAKNSYYLKEAYNYNVAGFFIKPFTFLELATSIAAIRDLWVLCRNI
jgi:CheY-like chemotaxis protein